MVNWLMSDFRNMPSNKILERDNVLLLEAVDTWEEGASFSLQDDGRIHIDVAEEQALDSYNETFSCGVTLTHEQAVALRDWLCKAVPSGSLEHDAPK